MKKHIKMSEKVFRGGLGLFWSSNEVKMTKCCLVCIRAQAPLEEAWVLWWVSKWVKTTEKGLSRHVLTCFHHFWALFYLKPTRNALFTPFLVQNGQVAVTKEVWTYFTRQKPILVPDGPRPQRKTFLDIFWRVFIISGLYFAQNRREMHFLRHFWVKISQMPQKWSFFSTKFA